MPQTRRETKMDSDNLVQKISSSVVSQLQCKIDELDSNILRIEKQLNEKLVKLDRLEDMDKQLVKLCSSLKTLGEDVSLNKSELLVIKKQIDSSIQYSKKNSLRFCGVNEGDKEDPVGIISDFISNTMKIPCSVHDIENAVRVGKFVPNSSKPRSILVTFVHTWKKTEVLRAKRNLRSSGVNVAIFEDLTKVRYEQLLAAKGKYGKDKAWSSAGKIYIMHNGKKTLYVEDDL